MSENSSKNTAFTLAPLGAGDLIDRAVRFYRSNFWTFIWIAAPPIVIGTMISVGWTILGRKFFSVGLSNEPVEMIFYYIFTGFGSLIIWLTETVATLTVMGGASRNFVRHLLFGEPVTFRETYKNVRQRFGGLIFTSLILSIFIGVLGATILNFGLVFTVLAVTLTIEAFSFSTVLTFIVSFVLVFAILFGAVWLFFLVASRFAYVPQVMMVEGQSVFSAIGRSISLASGNVRRFAALFIFSSFATYSALSLLYIPLGWYAYANGVELFSFDADMIPAWYQIISQFVWQISFILLTPVWMIGLCLLYVDESVRHEGYDIELLAAQRLGEIPTVSREFSNPLQPALSGQSALNQTRKEHSKMITLGLD